MRTPYLHGVEITEPEKLALVEFLSPGWGTVGRKLKGCEDEDRLRKLLHAEIVTKRREGMVTNLLGRLRSSERKRILREILKRRVPQ